MEPPENIIRNTSDVDFGTVPAGKRIMSLYHLKIGERKKFKSEEMVPCYRLVFKDREVDDAFAFLSLTPTTDPRGNLVKLLNSMTQGGATEFDRDNTEAYYQLLLAQVGKWFRCQVEHVQRDDGGIWVNLKPDIYPVNDPSLGEAPVKKEKQEVHGGNAQVSTGFEGYDNHGSNGKTEIDPADKEYNREDWLRVRPHLYKIDLDEDGPDVRAKKEAFLAAQDVKLNHITDVWHAKEPIKGLEKYKIENMSGEQVAFDEDKIPF